ncbi:Transcriptional regulatory protein LiaR [Candidatus Methylomirabilis lanthanidiphila]|uniref:Transcriptional regulatory protein LiaR n=1 Tax=Candidatus Methylomirabilis lanthanidiphila TaxID=2211376 RepID=A0A564ZN06_9BACT|nr:LuxR C-terminal-related transcriptional regulator [Candidatus Methylomirabilis lanthanidiphila]VUZ86022.1 Transcriptional regulatory protein LiaR [Candidatus Methylomirabilis lanthanidiphila]
MRNRADAANTAKTTARARAPTGDVVRHRGPSSQQGGAWIRSLFQGLPEGICLIDPSMRVVLWNRAATEITGYGASELLGCRCYLKGNGLDLERFCRAECPVSGEDKSLTGCRGCVKWQYPWTLVLPARHVDVALLILIFRHVPFTQQLPTCPDTSSPCMLARYAAQRGPEVARRLLALTLREREILGLLAGGKTAKPIATALGISLPTVRTHIQSILRKLDVHSCLELVAFLRHMTEGVPPACS